MIKFFCIAHWDCFLVSIGIKRNCHNVQKNIDFSLFLCYNENVHKIIINSYNKYKDGDNMKTKKISVSEKRQITIPKEFFDT